MSMLMKNSRALRLDCRAAKKAAKVRTMHSRVVLATAWRTRGTAWLTGWARLFLIPSPRKQACCTQMPALWG